MKPHPYANIFPMMDESELEALSEDIVANGQKEVITIYHNQILDGRNRYAACLKAHITPSTKELPTGTDAFKFVISKNLHRRHLDETGRAFLAAGMVKLGRELTPVGVKPISVAKAAKALNVSPRSVDRAINIEENAPETVEAVKAKEISLAKADAQIAKRPAKVITPEEQSNAAYRLK